MEVEIKTALSERWVRIPQTRDRSLGNGAAGGVPRLAGTIDIVDWHYGRNE